MPIIATPDEGATLLEDEESISSKVTPRGRSMVISWIVRGSMNDSFKAADGDDRRIRLRCKGGLSNGPSGERVFDARPVLVIGGSRNARPS